MKSEYQTGGFPWFSTSMMVSRLSTLVVLTRHKPSTCIPEGTPDPVFGASFMWTTRRAFGVRQSTKMRWIISVVTTVFYVPVALDLLVLNLPDPFDI